MTEHCIHHKIELVWKMESPKIIASLTKMVRNVGVAEDLAQDTLILAFERWPNSGIPNNPGAWLMTTAKRRAIDYFRRNKLHNQKYHEIAYQLESHHEVDWDQVLDDEIGDELLRLIFMTCHPILSQKARVALTLRLLGGLTTEEIARAFLVAEPTVAQRIVRAKRTLSAAQVPFEVPLKGEFEERLSSVLEVIYLMFNEGYSGSSSDNCIRPVLCSEALRLCQHIADIIPNESEVHGLIALMEIQSSRFNARVDPAGDPILLLEQNRELWDQLMISRGYHALEKAERLGGTLGMYGLQASIAACHARAKTAEETDWVRISALYHELAQLTPSPVVELNRAVALSMAYGAAAGLEIVDYLHLDPVMKNYYLLPSTRGNLLQKLGRLSEAYEEYMRAASLTTNTRQREYLLKQANDCK
ncbi:RNA polymerase subunit sigma-24 [Bacillus sp. SA1-12]|uniref:RNA polymerase sigma factor n=1 Tax=Bacillus sp. SA1-12 TaxID=1455638 RepID=UPI00062738E6|nr:RNA polymerase sigma factor [Bacillus sp. SA1-12]KKI91221.1 RNA polymerase subunit sigma-24 [Bacillus sp. SA1-12]